MGGILRRSGRELDLDPRGDLGGNTRKTHSITGGTYEYCHILAGHVRLHEEGHAPQEFRAGDAFVMKPEFRGVWETIETVRKFWLIASVS